VYILDKIREEKIIYLDKVLTIKIYSDSIDIHSIKKGVTMTAFKLDVEKVITITATYLIDAESEDEARDIIDIKDSNGKIEPNNVALDESIYDDRLGNDSGTWEVQEEVEIEDITELKIEKEVA
tara:strand:- start:1537 stop:1908 length:372 start_codon:yes stop_codon:yes gene_type:complete